jgi:hypothetical protein
MSAKTHFDISAHQQTYAGFIKATIISATVIAVLLSAMAFFLV